MSNQEILNELSRIECELYYMKDGSDDSNGVSMENLTTVHGLVRKALEAWHQATGLTLTE